MLQEDAGAARVLVREHADAARPAAATAHLTGVALQLAPLPRRTRDTFQNLVNFLQNLLRFLHPR